jgi:hypothetical protein
MAQVAKAPKSERLRLLKTEPVGRLEDRVTGGRALYRRCDFWSLCLPDMIHLASMPAVTVSWESHQFSHIHSLALLEIKAS